MPEMPHTREQHRQTMFVTRGDRVGVALRPRRSTLNWIVPGTAPERSTGTARELHTKKLVAGQGM